MLLNTMSTMIVKKQKVKRVLALVAAFFLMYNTVAQIPILSLTLTAKDTIVCVGQQVSITLSNTTPQSIETWKCYLWKVGVDTVIINQECGKPFVITPQVPTVETYSVELIPSGQQHHANSPELRIVVIPPAVAGKIEHSKNTVEN